MDSQAESTSSILSSAEKRLGLPSVGYRPCWNKRHLKKPSFDPFRELSLKFPKKSQLISQLRSTHPGIEFREALFTVIIDEVKADLSTFTFGSNVTEKYKDEVYMKCYKVTPCQEPDCDAEFCFNFHGSEDRRRPLTVHPNGLWSYKPDSCRGGKVCMGEDCTLAHSKNEVDYHPMKYKTQMCDSKRNPLGLCRLGIHCPNAHETGELRSGSPNILNLSKSAPALHSLPVIESQVPKPDPEYQISSLSLNELSKIHLSTTTHKMIEELQTVQHERMRYDLMLKETKGKLAAAEKRVSCAFCQTRKRSRLLSCGHCVCESCAEAISKECGICQAPLAQVVKLKTGR